LHLFQIFGSYSLCLSDHNDVSINIDHSIFSIISNIKTGMKINCIDIKIYSVSRFTLYSVYIVIKTKKFLVALILRLSN